jgi:2,3-bisphosphoglycerate-independent phosphoglycerate mutase
MANEIIDQLAVTNTTKIVLVVLDGLGGCPMEPGGPTELEAAKIPNLDRLAAESACGLMDPIYPGVTPGSGPSHLALFGYDPIESNIGRGVLSALGINFPLREGDVAARINFATMDESGLITDRRAGRISSEENARLCRKVREAVKIDGDFEWFLETVKEHRAILVLRGAGLGDEVPDTDPQVEGREPIPLAAGDEESRLTIRLVQEFVEQARSALSTEPAANMVLLRGFARHKPYPTMYERFGLRSLALASYPMYKGLSRLVGMDVLDGLDVLEEEIQALKKSYDDYDYFFIHYKNTDSRGEDGDFDAKVEAIETADALLPEIMSLEPDVLAVTADHSTPAFLKSHSWHPVPLSVRSTDVRRDRVQTFDELSFTYGGLGRIQSIHLMGILLACARRLKKYGA